MNFSSQEDVKNTILVPFITILSIRRFSFVGTHPRNNLGMRQLMEALSQVWQLCYFNHVLYLWNHSSYTSEFCQFTKAKLSRLLGYIMLFFSLAIHFGTTFFLVNGG